MHTTLHIHRPKRVGFWFGLQPFPMSRFSQQMCMKLRIGAATQDAYASPSLETSRPVIASSATLRAPSDILEIIHRRTSIR